ncbi:MAG TPA: WbuC family cupin fold metalloprotein [Armatimonadota bacterium]|nr:WbuC family cupin fold metalloprotein [Armatimonadota bacterium]
MANVLFAGVGGQGVVTASDLLAHAALRAGWNVKKAETHGMAQRGGSVVTHVRVSADQPVHSRLIPHGCADYLIALELLEGVRTLWMLAPGGDSFGIDVPHAHWHTVVALQPGTVIFEAKSGPYQPLLPEEKAPWAPVEGAAGVDVYLRQIESLFPTG